ncbi:platelet-activating factor acetylhydrolase 2: cytoplasmic-like protein [Dinothrombium tinctorium]|uniref:1-alkyl-2-acetylglycerophosphocholine esterase n=1 Tax=Dinothrombium tinctorium TaxID=1965070 RepID=A0A3S4R178_9ACAR|nr:platelet-activating factor acetylhydrolase 2: cytoplasmic-like protein [Dinothrombium tinctorium]
MKKGITVRRDKKLRINDRKHIPMPTGPFQVIGCRDLMTGASKFTGVLLRLYYPAANQARDMREYYLMWPNWLPHENYRSAYAEVSKYNNSVYKALNWAIGDGFIPCIPNAKPLRDDHKWPVIVFSHGIGACRTTYSALCIEFASHGFVVAAIEHRDASACCTFYAKEVHLSMYGSNARLSQSEYNLNDMRDDDEFEDSNANRTKKTLAKTFLPQVTVEWIPHSHIKVDESHYSIGNKQVYQRVRECSRTLDLLESLNAGYEIQNLLDQLLDPSEFEGILDLERVSLCGHSIGAATVLLALSSELRFKVGICLDAWLFPVKKENFDCLSQPVIFINTEKFHSKQNLRKIREIANPSFLKCSNAQDTISNRNKERSSDETPERKVYTLKGSLHYNITDVPFLMSWTARKLCGTDSSMDRFTALDLATSLALDFICSNLNIPLSSDNEVYLNLHRKRIKSGINVRNSSLKFNGRSHLPLPTGPYKVVASKDILFEEPSGKGVLLRLFYPSACQSSEITEFYNEWPNWVPHENYVKGIAKIFNINSYWIHNALKWLLSQTYVPSVPDSKPLRQADYKWPLIIFSHGWGGCRTMYSTICIELASNGFLVAALEHRDNSACCTFSLSKVNQSEVDKEKNNKVASLETNSIEWIDHSPFRRTIDLYEAMNEKVKNRVDECSRVLNLFEAINAGRRILDYQLYSVSDNMKINRIVDLSEFENILDMEKVIVMGHSFGGATATLALTEDSRFKIGVILDAWMYPIKDESFDDLQKPILFVNMESFQTEESLSKMRNIVNSNFNPNQSGLTNSNMKIFTLRGTSHLNQCDIPFVTNWLARKVFLRKSKIDRFVAHDLTMCLSLDFIFKQLNLGKPLSTLSTDSYFALHQGKLRDELCSKL